MTAYAQPNLGSSQKTTIGVIVLVAAFLLLASLIGYYALQAVEKEIRDETGEALETVLDTIHDATRSWLTERKLDLLRFTEHPVMQDLVGAQLQAIREGDSVANRDALLELRTFYQQHDVSKNALGFFVITPDHISIASLRDANTGTENLIYQRHPNLMKRAFNGDVILIPPLPSDVPLKDIHGHFIEGASTMFLAGPVRDPHGTIIAVATLRLDPAQDLNRIAKLGRIGESGESYAFDRNGIMLTESRFEAQLVNIGLIPENHRGHYTIRLGDPGNNLVDSPRPLPPTADLPLTRMAASATRGDNSKDTGGYRDYRGVQVLGAWVWDEEMGIGMTTEIDEDDALAAYFAVRTPLIIGLVSTTVVSLVLLALFMVMARQGRQQLEKAYDDLELRVQERTEELRLARDTAESANAAKSQFLANVSHELRTPLTSIRGAISLIQGGAIGPVNGKMKEMIDLSQRNAERLLSLINDLLDVEKMNAGKLEFVLEHQPLMPLIEEAIATNQGYANQFDVELKFTRRAESVMVNVDTFRFQQIMSNLISNAAKYSPGHDSVDISVVVDRDHVRIAVADHGPGIPAAFRERVFEQFAQADGSSTRTKGGTGLGLNITRTMVENMDGKISFTTTEGKGTTFFIDLPMVSD